MSILGASNNLILIRFILNKKEIQTALPPGTLLLDFIRYHQHQMGTKIGCREGDCGACSVLVGDFKNKNLHYQSATSCLTALGNVHGKHVISIEGLNMAELNLVQQAMKDESATQCGFCTPGFVVSLSGFCLTEQEPTEENVLAAISGNICRCTGYKSIEKAAGTVCKSLENRGNESPIDFAIRKNYLPEYLTEIPARLLALKQNLNGALQPKTDKPKFLGGGTDLYVQQHETMHHEDIDFLFDQSDLKGIVQKGDICEMGAASTVTDMLESPVFQAHFPNLKQIGKLVSSEPIRNIATIAGNIINASPIGDLSIFFLALDAKIHLKNGNEKRIVPLRNLYLGYKKLDRLPEEIVEKISFKLPDGQSKINFEKVCKRTHLDIASVNSALFVELEGFKILNAGLSAGGVGPVPLFLPKSSAFLSAKTVSIELLEELLELIQTEISPISDVRGTETYKRTLLHQLVKAHFSVMFKELDVKQLMNLSL